MTVKTNGHRPYPDAARAVSNGHRPPSESTLTEFEQAGLERPDLNHPEASRLDVDEAEAIAPIVLDDDAQPQPDAVEAKEKSEKKSSKKNRLPLFLTIGAIALGVSGIFGWRWWQFQQTHVSTENAQIQGHVSPIAPRIDATVQQVLVKEGDYVKTGQPLVRLEDQDLGLKVQQAEAQLAVAQAQLRAATNTVQLTGNTNASQVSQSQARLTATQATVNAAQANVAQAQAALSADRAKVTQAQTALNQAKADFQRYQSLYQEGAIAAQQFEVSRTAYETAQANLAGAQQTIARDQAAIQTAIAQLRQAQAEVTASQGQVAETQASGQNVAVQQNQQQLAQAQVRQAQAALNLARQQLTYTTLNAPVTGYVGQLTAQVGQKVQSGQALMALVPLKADQVYVEANFRETALNKLRIGEKADVEVDAYPGQTFPATIAGISPATGSRFALLPPDNATGNFNKVVQWVPVRLVFDANSDPNHQLRPGLSVKVTVDSTSAPTTAHKPSQPLGY